MILKNEWLKWSVKILVESISLFKKRKVLNTNVFYLFVVVSNQPYPYGTPVGPNTMGGWNR